MRRILFLLVSVVLLGACAAPKQARVVEDFNFDWCFRLGDSTSYATNEYDDSSWRELHLPHDWAIEGNFARENPSTPGGGALPGGVGWYRKHFRVESLDRAVSLEFDGVFMNSTVWVNGHEVGHRPYGYASFAYDVTPYLVEGENVVAVRCDNSLQPNSRWYAGCGIYRNVRKVVTDPLRIAYNGIYITTPEITEEQAAVEIETTLENRSADDRQVTLQQQILSQAGRCVATLQQTVTVAAHSVQPIRLRTTVKQPQRWDLDNPVQYTLVSRVEEHEAVIDDCRTRFGIREIAFSPTEGFSLNGRAVKLKGVCMHHDLGALGAAVHRRAIERQLEILQQMGCNAIRTAHNPPAPELLDLCDSMGFVVMDEALDMWQRRKTEYDYSRFFDAWHERDVQDFVRRDRNHPSVIMWSVGNEILEQWNSNEEDSELTAEQANLLMNYRSQLPQEATRDENPSTILTHHMVQLVKELDATRPVTAGCNEPAPSNNLLRSGALDLVGYNYHEQWYDSIPMWYPTLPALGSETVSSVQTRGFYLQPSTREQVQPEAWWKPYETAHFQCSAYDHSRVPWGALHEKSWIDIRDRKFMAGTFVWTGFDYLGEPTPYSWPARSSYFGIVDLAGFPKDVYYMYRAEWTDRPTLHLYPHWNWQEGDKIDLWVYYNQADEVELLVNGVSQGRQAKRADRLHCIWEQVPYQAGEITAIAYQNGCEVSRTSRKTAGAVAALRLTADRTILAADGYDLAYITVDALDSAQNEVPTAMNDLTFEVAGAGELVGVDNGNPIEHLCMKKNCMPLFNGKALAIVRSLRGEVGTISLTVRGEGLEQQIELSAHR